MIIESLLAVAGAGSAAATASAAPPAFCVAGATVEALAWNRWWPATVVEARSDGNCVVKHKAYAGVENMEHMPPDRVRESQGAPAEGVPVGASAGRAASAPVAPVGTSAGRTNSAGVETTPERIYEDFSRDAQAATARYIGQQVQITGVADRIDEGSITFFRLGTDLVARCAFEPADRAALGRVAQGETVTVKGFGATRVSHHVIDLTSCRVVSSGGKPAQASVPARPPLGSYRCMAGGQPVGRLTLSASNYSVDGVTGGYKYNPASRQFTWQGGAYADFGWSGRWEAGPPRRDGRADPRITLRDGKRLEVACLPSAQ